MKKIYFLFLFIFITLKGVSQNVDLIRTWQLTKVTIDNTDFIPEDYSYFPTLDLYEENSEYLIGFATPFKAYCTSFINNFQTNPDGFFIDQTNMVCLAEVLCKGDPNNNPCVIIHEKHSEMYLEIDTLITYEISENPDKSFSLEINNAEGNAAYYSSVLLSNAENFVINTSLIPNPVSNTLSVISENYEIELLTVYNLSGQKLMEFKNKDNTLDVSILQNGIYFLEITTKKGKVIEKFIKQ